MKTSPSLNRRHFLQAGLLGSTALAAVSWPSAARAALTKAQRDPFDGLKLGMASYTLRKFTLDQAIAMTKAAGVKYICLKDVHLPMKSSTEQRKEEEDKERKWHRVERSYGSFTRQIQLPKGIESDAVTAAYKDGLLSLTIAKPKPAQKKSTTVEIK